MSTATLKRPLTETELERPRALFAGSAVLTVAGLTVLAAALRFAGIGHQGFWFDEANTALLVHASPGKMLALIPQRESTPPLYYCVAWIWARIFGYSETGLRSLSALAGVLIVPAAYGTGAKLISRRAGLIAAALSACNPFLIWYSQEARSYSLLVLLSALSLLAFAFARAEPSARHVAAWVIASGLALATHYYSLLVVVPEAFWLLWLHRRSRAAIAGVGLVGAFGLALIPLAISQNGTGHTNWISSVALGRRLAEVVPQFLVGFGAVAYDPLVWASIGLCVLALAGLVRFGEPAERRRTLAVGAVAAGGLILNLLLLAAGIDDLITRNVVALWMPAALLIAGSLSAIRPGGAGVAVAGALCAIGVTAAVSVATTRNLQRPDWRGVAQVLGTRPAAGAGARAVLVQHYKDLLPLSLYLPGLNAFPRAGAPVSELDIISFTDPASAGFCWWGSACNLWPSRMQSRLSVTGFHQVSLRRVYQFTIMRLVSDRPVALTRSALAGALQTTRLPNDGLLFQRP